MQRIFIVRHGKTAWNIAKRLQGAGADSPLLTDHPEQYDQIARYLDQYQFTAAFASPLNRAMETGRIITSKLHNNLPLTVTAIPDLTEISFGEWEGKTRAELITKHPAMFAKMSRRENDPALSAIGMEDFDHARARFAQAVRDIASQLGANDNALIFAHGGITQLGVKELTGNENLLGLKNLSTSIIAIKDGKFYLDAYNQTAYLDHVDLNEGNVSIL